MIATKIGKLLLLEKMSIHVRIAEEIGGILRHEEVRRCSIK